MVERVLHGANVTACCTSLATAADVSLAGGAATAIGAALSGLAIFKGSDSTTQTTTTAMAAAFEAQLTHTHLSDGDRKVLRLMFKTHPPTLEDIAEGNEDPDQVATVMCARITELGDKTDSAFQSSARLHQFAQLTSATLAPLLKPQTRSEATGAKLLARTGQHTEQLAKLMEMMEAQGSDTRLHAAGITPQTITQLAARISAKTDDLGQAWRDLESAMEIAVKVQTEGQTRSNHGDFVDTVLARVADLSATGDYTSANAAIDAALDDAEAAKARLLESGVNIAKLSGDIERAASLLIAQADHAAGGAAEFEALRVIWEQYYVRGRDKGVTQDSELAISLANHVHARATTSMERGTALNDLGTALAILGERESGADRLNAAVNAYENALLQLTREKDPLEWAMTQMNLGNALQTLGQRESGTDRLDSAITAYENALQEWTREKDPLQWAMTQMNLGNALKSLGERESGTDRLNAAITAYENALQEWTLDKVPLDWAKVQGNLANVSMTFFDKTKDALHLEQARAYVNAARGVFAQAGANHYVGVTDAILAKIAALEATL